MEKVTHFFRNYSSSSIFLIIVQPVFFGCTRFAENFDKYRIYFMFYGLFAAAAVAYFLTFFSGQPSQYTAEHANLYDFDNTAFQRLTYSLFALLLFSTALFLALSQKRLGFPYFRDFKKKYSLQLQTIVSLLILIIALPLFFSYIDTIFDKRTFLTVVGCLVIFGVLTGLSGSNKGLFILSAITVAAFFFFYVLPLKATFVIADGGLWGLDHHWTGVIGHGLMSKIFTNETLKTIPEYGVYLNKLITLTGSSSTFTGLGGAIKFLQVIHILFAGMIFTILLQRFGNRNIGHALISFLLIILILAPIISAVAPSMHVPNQSPVRFIFIPIVLIFASLIARPGVLLWWTLSGPLCALAAVYNLETGLVCTIGLGFALFIRSMKKGYLPVLAGGVLFLVSFILSGYLLLTFSGYGSDNLSNLPALLGLFAAGYGGKSFFWYLPFFVIMSHVFYLFFGWIKNCRDKEPMSGSDVQAVAIIGMIVAFMPYMTNRFYEMNMWIPVLLYLLLILPKLAGKDFWQRVMILLFVIGLVTPWHLEKSSLFVKNLKKNWTLTASDKCLIGLAASERLCNYVAAQADELRDVMDTTDAIWISALPLTVSSLSKIPPSLTRADPFAYARTPDHHSNLVNEIVEKSPRQILIDRVDILNPAGIAPSVADWQKRLIADAGYRIVRQSDHWIYATKSD